MNQQQLFELHEQHHRLNINWDEFFKPYRDWESEYRDKEFKRQTNLVNAIPELKKCKTLLYPGAGYDFSTLRFFMEVSGVKDYYYCDYMNYDITDNSVYNNLVEQLSTYGYLVIKAGELQPGYFNQSRWGQFWHRDHIRFGGDVQNSFISLYRIIRGGKILNLYYLGTEAIQSYEILLKNNKKMDIVVTQDHGLGGLWTTFCQGSILETLANQYNKLPDILMVGEDYQPWEGYENISSNFGSFGLHQAPRKLCRLR
jgi:hypothetical protein